MANRKLANKDGQKKPSDFSHLKWPAIIMGIFIIFVIAIFDYCSRQGNL